MSRVINVSNRLPVSIKNGEIKPSSGGLVSALAAVDNLIWIGWQGGDIGSGESREKLINELREKHNYIPVDLTADEVEDYYEGFSNSTTWPLLHYMSNYFHYKAKWFRAYQAVNEKFAEVILKEAKEGDRVWIHDYQLMLLPQLIKEKRPELKVGFFLHTPFPSYEIFRIHPDREALLEGLLGADLIGFHTYGYLRHFRSTVLRILGYESTMDGIFKDQHLTKIGVFPIGINSKAFEDTLNDENYHETLKKFRYEYHERQVVLSVERMDYTKGIPEKLLAIEEYFMRYPGQAEKVIFIIVAVPSRENVEEYKVLKERVELLVSRINGKYASISNIPVHFINKPIPFHELCALYTLSEVALVTPVMDGMNLVAKEYIACQRDDDGVLILSEFAGAAQELFSSILVNPYHHYEVAEKIHQALNTDLPTRQAMNAPMKQRVMKYDSVFWAGDFLKQLSSVESESTGSSSLPVLDPKQFLSWCREDETALFLDYDGTLREFVNDPQNAKPAQDLLANLEKIIASGKLRLYIVSGRDRDFLDKHFGHLNMTLIAEHGFYSRHAGEEKWEPLAENTDMSWKAHFLEIFNMYSQSTPGTAVEEKATALVWHYRKADPEFGSWKASELMGELYEAVSNIPVEIHHGAKIVEISSQDVSKGRAVELFCSKDKIKNSICIGDDLTDETMFRLHRENHTSIKVGGGETQADFRLSSPKKVREYIQLLANSL